MYLPSRRPTAEEWQVLAWACILLFITVGACGMYYGLTASPQQAETAVQIRRISLSFWGLAAIVYLVKRGIEKFIE